MQMCEVSIWCEGKYSWLLVCGKEWGVVGSSPDAECVDLFPLLSVWSWHSPPPSLARGRNEGMCVRFPTLHKKFEPEVYPKLGPSNMWWKRFGIKLRVNLALWDLALKGINWPCSGTGAEKFFSCGKWDERRRGKFAESKIFLIELIGCKSIS